MQLSRFFVNFDNVSRINSENQKFKSIEAYREYKNECLEVKNRLLEK